MSVKIFLFGPSCAGKSTLGKNLQKNLADQWSYLDRDDLDDCVADRLLDEKIESLKTKVIVDAQVPWREKREDELYFLLLPPLEILLERDAERTRRLERTEKRAFGARCYVIETYEALEKLDKTMFDDSFDSSRESIKDEIEKIRSIICLFEREH